MWHVELEVNMKLSQWQMHVWSYVHTHHYNQNDRLGPASAEFANTYSFMQWRENKFFVRQADGEGAGKWLHLQGDGFLGPASPWWAAAIALHPTTSAIEQQLWDQDHFLNIYHYYPSQEAGIKLDVLRERSKQHGYGYLGALASSLRAPKQVILHTELFAKGFTRFRMGVRRTCGTATSHRGAALAQDRLRHRERCFGTLRASWRVKNFFSAWRSLVQMQNEALRAQQDHEAQLRAILDLRELLAQKERFSAGAGKHAALCALWCSNSVSVPEELEVRQLSLLLATSRRKRSALEHGIHIIQTGASDLVICLRVLGAWRRLSLEGRLTGTLRRVEADAEQREANLERELMLQLEEATATIRRLEGELRSSERRHRVLSEEIASLQGLLDDAERQQRKERRCSSAQKVSECIAAESSGGAAAAFRPLGAAGRGSERAASEGARKLVLRPCRELWNQRPLHGRCGSER
eukprot:s6430_g3.t1